MPKRELVRRMDETRGQRRQLMGDLYQQFLVRPDTPQPDDIPPDVPTGLALAGYIEPAAPMTGYVLATWTANTEADLAGYEVRWKVEGWYTGMPSPTDPEYSYFPTISASAKIETTMWNATYYVGIRAIDMWENPSGWSDSVSIGTDEFMQPPILGAPTVGLEAPGGDIESTASANVYSASYYGRDAVFVITGGSEMNIRGVVYDLLPA